MLLYILTICNFKHLSALLLNHSKLPYPLAYHFALNFVMVYSVVTSLLATSWVARDVREQLLNIEEKTSDETKTQDIDEEQSLMLSVGMAVASGDATAVAVASAKLVEFKNRHIQKLENDNKALAEGILLYWSVCFYTY